MGWIRVGSLTRLLLVAVVAAAACTPGGGGDGDGGDGGSVTLRILDNLSLIHI